jgi:hypothetical protein
MRPDGRRILLAALLVVSAAIFFVGTRAETGTGDAHASERLHSETGESAEEHASEGHAAESDATLFGVDLEATGFVVAAVVFSLVLAGLALWTRMRWVLLGIAVVALVFAVFDARELLHQIDESRTGIALAAGAAGLLHVGAGLVAAISSRGETPTA